MTKENGLWSLVCLQGMIRSSWIFKPLGSGFRDTKYARIVQKIRLILNSALGNEIRKSGKFGTFAFSRSDGNSNALIALDTLRRLMESLQSCFRVFRPF